jgi:hypothetical protein
VGTPSLEVVVVIVCDTLRLFEDETLRVRASVDDTELVVEGELVPEDVRDRPTVVVIVGVNPNVLVIRVEAE